MKHLHENQVTPIRISLPIGLDAENIGANRIIPFYRFEPHHYCRNFLGTARLTDSTIELKEGPTKDATVEIKGRTLFAAAPVANQNYFHWLIDMIGRMSISLPSAPFENVIINSRKAEYQKRSFAALGLDSNVIEIDHGDSVFCEDLFVPTLRRTGNHAPSRRMVEFLRKVYVPKSQQDTGLPKKIYISRRDAKVRKVVNEDEIESLLVRNGFETVKMEQHSFEEQVALAANADVIIGPHGAGLTNTAFCKPGAKVVEMFSPQFIGGLFYFVSEFAGAQYHYVVGRKMDSISAANDNSFDMYVEPTDLETVLEWIL